MRTRQQNIYQSARLAAGMTQEQAAEALHLGETTLRGYESGRVTPPDETVVLMSRAYGADRLRLDHACATDKLGVLPQQAMPADFVLVAVQLYNMLMKFAERHRGKQLLQIAEDGIIDEDERPLLDEIICELEGVSAALRAIKCCGTKKDRPDVGASKRSSPAEEMETHKTLNKSIIPKIPQNASKIGAGKAVIL